MIAGLLTIAGLVTTCVVCGRLATVLLPGCVGAAPSCANGGPTPVPPHSRAVESSRDGAARTQLSLVASATNTGGDNGRRQRRLDEPGQLVPGLGETSPPAPTFDAAADNWGAW